MLCLTQQCILNIGTCLKIHICNPQRKDICTSSSLHRKIIFQATRSLSIHALFKIQISFTHVLLTFCLLPCCSFVSFPCYAFCHSFLQFVILFCSCNSSHHSASACSRSAIRSSAFSIPTDILRKSSVIPSRSLVSTGTSPCVWSIGYVIRDSTPPRLSA